MTEIVRLMRHYANVPILAKPNAGLPKLIDGETVYDMTSDEFASFGKLQITESLRKLRKRHIRIMVLTQSLADLDMIYGKDERKAMLGNFKFTILLGCKDTETQEYFSKMIGDKPSFGDDENKNNRPIIRPAELAHLEQDLYVICDDGAVRLRKNFYFKS